MIFLLHVEWPEMHPYKLLLTYYVWRIVWLNWMAYSELPWRPFLGHQAWGWTTLRRGNVFITFTKFFLNVCHVFNVFSFYLNVFCIYVFNRVAEPLKWRSETMLIVVVKWKRPYSPSGGGTKWIVSVKKKFDP